MAGRAGLPAASPPSWTALKAAQLAAQATARQHAAVDRRHAAGRVQVPAPARRCRHGLGATRTGSGSAPGNRGPLLVSANVSSGQQITAVSRTSGQIDLFWIDYSGDGSANTCTRSRITDGSAGHASPGSTTASPHGTVQPGQLARTTIRPRSWRSPARGNHLDLFALGVGTRLSSVGIESSPTAAARRLSTTCTGPGGTPTRTAASGMTSSGSARDTRQTPCRCQRYHRLRADPDRRGRPRRRPLPVRHYDDGRLHTT